ncbi:hypothetical protein V6N13_147011 [Hibiscus sabdariffa]
MEMLAGKQVEVGTKLGAYMITFSGDCSTSDLGTTLQLCTCLLLRTKDSLRHTTPLPLFTKLNVLNTILLLSVFTVKNPCSREGSLHCICKSGERDYGNNYFFGPIRISDPGKVDPLGILIPQLGSSNFAIFGWNTKVPGSHIPLQP